MTIFAQSEADKIRLVSYSLRLIDRHAATRRFSHTSTRNADSYTLNSSIVNRDSYIDVAHWYDASGLLDFSISAPELCLA